MGYKALTSTSLEKHLQVWDRLWKEDSLKQSLLRWISMEQVQ